MKKPTKRPQKNKPPSKRNLHRQVNTKPSAHRFAQRQQRRVAVDELLADAPALPKKPVWEKTQQHPRWNGFSVGMILLAGVVLFLGSMIFLPVPNWAIDWLQQWPNWTLFTPPPQVSYCLQFPLFVLLIALLGPRLGSLFLFGYLVAGLAGLPLFSGGGGWAYVLKPTFGYWLGGFIVLPWMGQQGQLLLQRSANWSAGKVAVNAGLLALNTVLLMHTVGLLYLVMLGLCGQFPWEHVREVTVFYSLVSLPYDCLGALLALCLVRYVRFAMALWLYA